MRQGSYDEVPPYPGREPQSRTLANEVFEKLRADILSMSLPPGTKLRFDDLREAYGVGLSPLREALSRLAENRLVVATGQRGFRVPLVSVEDILDIAMVRKQIEGLALRLSIQNGDDVWEARVVAARHKVTLLEKAGKNVAEDVWESSIFWLDVRRPNSGKGPHSAGFSGRKTLSAVLHDGHHQIRTKTKFTSADSEDRETIPWKKSNWRTRKQWHGCSAQSQCWSTCSAPVTSSRASART